MNTALPIVMLLFSTGGILFGYYLLRNTRALDIEIPRWVAWTLMICGVLGVVGFDLWLIFRSG